MRGRLAVLVAVGALLITAEGAAAGPWDELRRPIDLPAVAPGERCPVSRVDDRVDWQSAGIFGGSGIGTGPVYAGLGGADPPGDLYVAPLRRTGWLRGKLFWYVVPAYRDRVLIRGRRLDSPGPLRFEKKPGRTARGLRIRRLADSDWEGQVRGSRGAPSGVLVRSPGCYGVQVDGTTFSRTIVFTVTP
jgi:hypothetical protein